MRAGEKSGDLDAAFARLADQLDRDEQLRGKVLSASIYPLLLATAGSIAVTVLLFFVLPRFVTLLEGSGATLPRSTATLLALSSALHRAWPVLLLIPFVIAAFAAWATNTDEGRRVWSATMLALPGVRTLRRYALAGRFARLVGVLLGGGAPLLTALDDTIESIGDPIARDDVGAHSHAGARGQLAARRGGRERRSFRRCSRSWSVSAKTRDSCACSS